MIIYFGASVIVRVVEYCYQKVSASSYQPSGGFFWLTKKQKDALIVVYAYYNELKSVAADCRDLNVATASLNWWQGELAAIFSCAGKPTHPVMQALQQVILEYKLPESELSCLISGIREGLVFSRYATFDDLKQHAQQELSVFFRLVVRILGAQDTSLLEYADKLGLVLRLTAILSSVGADARVGRIFLPVDELQQFNVPVSVILNALGGDNFIRLMDFQIERVLQYYRELAVMIHGQKKWRSQIYSLSSAAIGYALVREIQLDGVQHVLAYQLAIPRPRQWRIALNTWFWGFHP